MIPPMKHSLPWGAIAVTLTFLLLVSCLSGPSGGAHAGNPAAGTAEAGTTETGGQAAVAAQADVVVKYCATS